MSVFWGVSAFSIYHMYQINKAKSSPKPEQEPAFTPNQADLDTYIDKVMKR